MRHHILLPTDFSENAWSAAIYAINLYATQPCTFYFSHAWTFLNSGARTHISESYIAPLKTEAKEQLVRLTERAKTESKNSDHKFETIFCVGSVTESIEFAIKTHHISLIVMGTKGATGAAAFLFGSNTVTVINEMRLCPILLIPVNLEYVKPSHILFPTDFNRYYGEELKYIKQLADLNHSKIEILHINKKETLKQTQNSNFEMLTTYLKEYQHQFNWMPNSGKKEQVITEFIAENNINILTMINYKHSFIENLMKEPIIKKIGFHVKIPFLVIPCVK